MMTVTERQRQQQAELHQKLWDIANDLRGNLDASEFRNYMLGLIVDMFLSEKTEDVVNGLLEEDEISYREAWEDEEYREALQDELTTRIGYIVEPKYLFSRMIDEIEQGEFDIEKLSEAISAVEASTLGEASEDDFNHLFDDMDLTSSRLE